MSRNSVSLRLLEVLGGSYRPCEDEMLELAEAARLNKLYLAYLRAVGDVLGSELAREEARHRWFLRTRSRSWRP